MPTLCPLFLILFNRPGAAAYKGKSPHNTYVAGYSQDWYGSKIGGNTTAVRDGSRTATGQEKADNSWIELSDSVKDGLTGFGEIRQTSQVDVTSHKDKGQCECRERLNCSFHCRPKRLVAGRMEDVIMNPLNADVSRVDGIVPDNVHETA